MECRWLHGTDYAFRTLPSDTGGQVKFFERRKIDIATLGVSFIISFFLLANAGKSMPFPDSPWLEIVGAVSFLLAIAYAGFVSVFGYWVIVTALSLVIFALPPYPLVSAIITLFCILNLASTIHQESTKTDLPKDTE